MNKDLSGEGFTFPKVLNYDHKLFFDAIEGIVPLADDPNPVPYAYYNEMRIDGGLRHDLLMGLHYAPYHLCVVTGKRPAYNDGHIHYDYINDVKVIDELPEGVHVIPDDVKKKWDDKIKEYNHKNK